VRGRWGQIEGHAYAYLAHALAPMPSKRTGRCPVGSRWHRSSSAARRSSS
jgi:hypothetical protein